MCQLCAITDIAGRERWPKSIEPYKKDIAFLVTSAHDEYTALRTAVKDKTKEPTSTSDSFLDLLRLFVKLMDEVESEREKWWTSPAKREQRKELELTCNQLKLTELHKINNRLVEAIEAMSARLGLFVKWSLGMNGGIWELNASEFEGKSGGTAGAKVETAPMPKRP